MMNYWSDQFRQCLEELDGDRAMRIWKHVNPNLPAPSPKEILPTMHVARTAGESIPQRLRFYSHRWCCDNGFQSMLPDNLKPRAERMYPKAVGGVGISVNSPYPYVVKAIGDVMRVAVLEAHADGHEHQPKIVHARMMEARNKERRGLMLGRPPDPNWLRKRLGQ